MSAAQTNDRVNGINLTVLKETVSAIQADRELGKCHFRATNKWIDADHNCTSITNYYIAKQEHAHKQPFELHAGEPPMLAGNDEGANPVEHLLNALASCMTTSMVAHAAVQGIHIEELESKLEGDLNLVGFLGLDPKVPKGYTNIRVTFRVKTDSDNMEKVNKLFMFSPVYNTLINGTKVDVTVEPK